MSDTKISALPPASTPANADSVPIVQGSGPTAETRRLTFSQLRDAAQTDRAFHVRDFGAVGDGVTDDGPAIQAAVNALAAASGGILMFGPRRYRVATAITISGATIILQGAGFTEGPNADDGTWILVDTTGFTPFTFTGLTARGSAVRDLAVRQSHTNALAPGWTPTNYDYVFRVTDCLGAVDFENVFLCAVNKGIFCDNSGRLNIQRLRGQVFTNGIEIDRCLDIPRIQHVHFWTFLSSDANMLRYQQTNLDALLFRRCDGVFLDDIFVLGARSTVRFSSSAYGVTTKFYIGKLYADFTRFGVWIDGDGTMGQIASMTTHSEDIATGGGAVQVDGNGLRVDASNTQLQIGALRVDACQQNALRVNGSGNRLDVFAFRAERYNTLNDGSAAIHLAHVASGTANQLFLGSPPILGNGNGGPLANSGTNGSVAMMAPAGRVDRPGLMVGNIDSGFFSPGSTEMAASIGGAEVLRANAAGTITLGGVAGSHALGVTTPAGTVNELRVTGAATGGRVSAVVQGGDANVGLDLSSKGSGTVALRANGANAVVATNPANAVNSLTASGAATGGRVSVAAQGTDTNVGLDLAAKGSGTVALLSNGANAVVASNPASAVNNVLVSGAATAGRVSLAAQGTDTNVGVNLAGKGTGTVALQANSANSLVATNPASAVNNLQASGSATGVAPQLSAQGTDTNIGLQLAAKGTGAVQLMTRSAVGFELSAPGTPINSLRVNAAATGGRIGVVAQGTDTNIGLDVASKGTGTVALQANGASALVATNPVSAVNNVQVSGSATGAATQISAQGTDANVTLQLAGKGTGTVQSTVPFQLPSFTVATVPAAASYTGCLIYVSNGTANKRLAVSDGTSWRFPDGAVVS